MAAIAKDGHLSEASDKALNKVSWLFFFRDIYIMQNNLVIEGGGRVEWLKGENESAGEMNYFVFKKLANPPARRFLSAWRK